MNATNAPPRDVARASLRNVIWRWHFYAGLFCIPFILWLATTGTIYLFKPQIEALIDRPYDQIDPAETRAAAGRQVQAALAAVPGATLRAYELPRTARSAARIVVGRGAEQTRVYVDPVTLRILKIVREDERLMTVIFHLHGDLLLGNRGSMVVELAASWAIVMIATGLYLWWPGKARGVAGVFYPRLLRGGRVFWRDLHAVTGVWVSAFALFILLSGLPWAANWGAYFKEIRRLTGTDAIRQDWPSGVERPSLPDMAANDMADMPGMAPSPSSQEAQAAARNGTPPSYAPIDGVIAAVAPLHLADPVVIAPPAHAGDPWTARSDVQNRPLRTDLVIDPRNGAILSRLDFDQHSKIDRVVGIGVAAHEGQLFGWPNQLLSLLTASGLVLMSLSAVVLWRRRRPAGALGAPIAAQERRPPGGLIAAIALFCILLPELAASVIVVALTERLVLSRIPAIRAWLGLRAPTPRVVYRH